MSKCKKCHCDCHCSGDLHADDYGICTCDNCKCGKRTYKYQKDHATDMSFENEVKYDRKINDNVSRNLTSSSWLESF